MGLTLKVVSVLYFENHLSYNIILPGHKSFAQHIIMLYTLVYGINIGRYICPGCPSSLLLLINE